LPRGPVCQSSMNLNILHLSCTNFSISSIIFWSRTTMNLQGWELPAEGANLPASSTLRTSFSGTCLSLYLRMLRRSRMTFSTGFQSIPSCQVYISPNSPAFSGALPSISFVSMSIVSVMVPPS